MEQSVQKTHEAGEQIQTGKKTTSARALNLFDDMERFFDTFFKRGWLSPLHWERPSLGELTAPFEGKVPHVDVIDRDNEILVRAELPGVDKKNLQVSTTGDSVTIKGTTRHEEKQETGEYYRCEISAGSYVRTVALPCEVADSDAKATYKDGVLELTLPKLEKSKRRNIKVE